MLATPSIHKLLFYLSMLLGMGSSTLSEEVELRIDREVKTGRIAFKGILSTGDEGGAILEKLKNSSSFDERFEGVELKECMVRDVDGELHVDLFFHYSDETALLRPFGFRKEENELVFELAEREELLASNGSQEGKKLRWDSSVPRIHLELRGKPLDDEERKQAVELKASELDRSAP